MIRMSQKLFSIISSIGTSAFKQTATVHVTKQSIPAVYIWSSYWFFWTPTLIVQIENVFIVNYTNDLGIIYNLRFNFIKIKNFLPCIHFTFSLTKHLPFQIVRFEIATLWNNITCLIPSFFGRLKKIPLQFLTRSTLSNFESTEVPSQ